MKLVTVHGLVKPKLGTPCNGCGACCIAEPCEIAREALGAVSGRCPALEIEGGRAYCGMVRHPARYMFGEEAPESETGGVSVLFAAALGLGHGCDASDEEGDT